MSNRWKSITDTLTDIPSRIHFGGTGVMFGMGVITLNEIITIGSFIIGVLGFLVMWYYRSKNSKAYIQALQEAARRGYLNEPKE